MWTLQVLDKLKGKTIKEAIPHYAGDDIYLIELQFEDGDNVKIDNEHCQDKILQAFFVRD